MSATATKPKPKSAGKIRLQPLGDRVVVEREESESRTAGGILLPESAKNKPARGTVISVGEGKLTDDGTRKPAASEAGRPRALHQLRRRAIQSRRQELLLMHEEDILAVIE